MQISNMQKEINEIPEALERLIEKTEPDIVDAANEIRAINPGLVTTVARGSSDHASLYLKYAIECFAGIPVASLGPSVTSIYKKQLSLPRSVNIAISQSGQSPDIVETASMAKKGGAFNIAITNNVSSPLAKECKYVFNINAGEEKSVAATKTFVTSIFAGLLLLAHWKQDAELLRSLKGFPLLANRALECDWSPLLVHCEKLSSLYVLGRGPAMAIALEAALKFKETCQIHAEAFSSAEVMHGPKSIIGDDFTVLALAARDVSEKSIIDVANQLSTQGAKIYATTDQKIKAEKLPFTASGYSLTDPLLLIISYYKFVEQLARIKGLNPDNPPNLKKVTETV
jgi:glucosamine--fructose-6-phosphate aminotransferase (isomerizing)